MGFDAPLSYDNTREMFSIKIPLSPPVIVKAFEPTAEKLKMGFRTLVLSCQFCIIKNKLGPCYTRPGDKSFDPLCEENDVLKSFTAV